MTAVMLHTCLTCLTGQMSSAAGVIGQWWREIRFHRLHLGVTGLSHMWVNGGVGLPEGPAVECWSFLSQHNLTGTYSWYRLLASHYPTKVHIVESIGRTHQGRDIMAVHVSDWSDGHAGKSNKPKVYLQCLLHASKTNLTWLAQNQVCMFSVSTTRQESGSQAQCACILHGL